MDRQLVIELLARVRCKMQIIEPETFRTALDALEWCEKEIARTLNTAGTSQETIAYDPTADLPADYFEQSFFTEAS